MNASGAPIVLLLSARPEAHRILMDSLCERGVEVRVPRCPDRALPLLRDEPSLVLVDLVHGAALTPSLVTALNVRRGLARVVALHHGTLNHDPSCMDLNVDGFCGAEDFDGLVDALVTCGAFSGAPH